MLQTQPYSKRLLVLACSRRKKEVEGEVRAWELYDGPVYRTIKKLEREGNFPKDTDVFILSAAHGVIPRYKPIANYDLKMTRKIAIHQSQQKYCFTAVHPI